MVNRLKEWLVGLVAGKYVKSAVRHGGAALGVFLGTLLAAAGLDVKEAEQLAAVTTGSLEQVVVILIPYAIAQGLSWINAKKKD